MAGGIVCVVAALLVSYPFDALLPAEAQFWGTLALAALALGLFLLGGATLVVARAKEEL